MEEDAIELAVESLALDCPGLFEDSKHLSDREPQILYLRSFRSALMKNFQHFLQLVLLEVAFYQEGSFDHIPEIVTQQRTVH